MSSVVVQSAQSIINQLARNAGFQPDASIISAQGVAGGISQQNLSDWMHFLTDAIRSVWLPDKENPNIPWPDTVSSGSLTPSTGVISNAQIGMGDWARFWSANPGPYNNPQTAYPISYRQGPGEFYPQTALSTVFAFWRPLRPQFTYQTFVSTTTYPQGSLVYDPATSLIGTSHTSTTIDGMTSTAGLQPGMQVMGPGVQVGTVISTVTPNTSITINQATLSSLTGVTFFFGSGNVFLCILAAGALGSTIQNATNWLAQTVPDSLVKIVLEYAEGFRVQAKGNSPKERFDTADRLLAEEKARALPEGGPPMPWDFFQP